MKKRDRSMNVRLQKLYVYVVGCVLVLAMAFVTASVISHVGLKQPVVNVLALIAGFSMGYSVGKVVNYYIERKLKEADQEQREAEVRA
jgi:membrane protein YqaA with SNARE-associated domain